MPNIKSAKKRVLVAERNRLRNKTWKSSIRTVRNQVADAVKSASPENAATALSHAYEIIDKAVTKGVLHKNSAARRKSRLAAKVVAIQAK
ncbi:MAG: 30S ribosomal protein S20 [Leptolyngbya sp.]|nr:30S ribosomal protein S20 [Candidatus Melainabacteria bacterium]